MVERGAARGVGDGGGGLAVDEGGDGDAGQLRAVRARARQVDAAVDDAARRAARQDEEGERVRRGEHGGERKVALRQRLRICGGGGRAASQAACRASRAIDVVRSGRAEARVGAVRHDARILARQPRRAADEVHVRRQRRRQRVAVRAAQIAGLRRAAVAPGADVASEQLLRSRDGQRHAHEAAGRFHRLRSSCRLHLGGVHTRPNERVAEGGARSRRRRRHRLRLC
mmetsp:Transcript_14309/g.49720  ORF Transcript_14309/g.49720 Transcript_14309/m.49720 type:complete len:227 (+) Transcript_14309:1436-2116(+)